MFSFPWQQSLRICWSMIFVIDRRLFRLRTTIGFIIFWRIQCHCVHIWSDGKYNLSEFVCLFENLVYNFIRLKISCISKKYFIILSTNDHFWEISRFFHLLAIYIFHDKIFNGPYFPIWGFWKNIHNGNR